MWTCIRLRLSFSLLFLLQLNMKGQAQASGHSKKTCCCEQKTVGAYNYTLDTTGTVPAGLNCLNDCVYTRDNSDGSQYCFAPGYEPVTCTKGPYIEIVNYCKDSEGAKGNIFYYLGMYPRANYTVGPAISHTCVKVKDVASVDEVTAMVSFGYPIGSIKCTSWDYFTNTLQGHPSKFNIACKDGEYDECIVHPAEN